MLTAFHLLRFPPEIILSIAAQLASERDMSILSHACRNLHNLLEAFRFRHNTRNGNGYALLEGAITGNIGLMTKALDLGRANIDFVWSSQDPRVAEVLMRQQKAYDKATQRPLPDSLGKPRGSGYWDPLRDVVHTTYEGFNGHIWVCETRLPPLGFAVLHNRAEGARFLLQRNANRVPPLLSWAAQKGFADAVTVLLEYGDYSPCIPNPQDDADFRDSAVHHAIKNVDYKTSRILIEHDPVGVASVLQSSPGKAKLATGKVVSLEQNEFEAFLDLLISNDIPIHRWPHPVFEGPNDQVALLRYCAGNAVTRTPDKLRFLLSSHIYTLDEMRNQLEQSRILSMAVCKADIAMVRYYFEIVDTCRPPNNDKVLLNLTQPPRGNANTMLHAALQHGQRCCPRKCSDVPDIIHAILERPGAKDALLHVPATGEGAGSGWGLKPLIWHVRRAIHGNIPDDEKYKNFHQTVDGNQTSRRRRPRELTPIIDDNSVPATRWWCARTLKVLLEAEDEVQRDQSSSTAGYANDDSHIIAAINEVFRPKFYCRGCKETLTTHLGHDRAAKIHLGLRSKFDRRNVPAHPQSDPTATLLQEVCEENLSELAKERKEKGKELMSQYDRFSDTIERLQRRDVLSRNAFFNRSSE